MKTLLSAAALAAMLVSGAALADGPGMNERGMKGPGMSDAHGDIQKKMHSRMHDDDQHPRAQYGEDHAGKGKHGRHSASESDHPGRGHDNDDDDHGPRHKSKMGHERS